MSITEKSEKKMLSNLKGDSRSGLKIEVGPDKRMRLVLDKSEGSSRTYISPAYLAQGELDSLPNETLYDGQDEDFDF
jgi:hypothetical protein